MTTRNSFPFVYSLLFSILAFLSHGYSFGIGDQSIHIPLIYKLQDVNLYPGDIIFEAGQQNLSLFYLLSEKFISYSVSLNNYFLILYFINSLLFYLVLYRIGKKILNNNFQIIIFGLFFIVPVHIAGSAIMSIETSLVPRGIAFTASLWALYYLLVRRPKPFYLLSLIVFLIHPISFVYLSVLAVFYKGRNQITFKRFILLISIIIILITVSTTFYGKISSDWLSILKLRNNYAFLNLWGAKAFISLILILTPLIYYLYSSKKKNTNIYNLVVTVFTASTFLFILQLIFTVFIPNILVVKLQLSRVFIYCYFLSALILSSLIWNKYQKKLLYLLTSLILIYSFINMNNLIVLQNSNWIGVQRWVNQYTEEDCIFLTPFENQGFRVYSQRPVVSEYKDGTLSFYSRQFALDWYARLIDIGDWEKLGVDRINNLQDKYKYSYLVGSSTLKLPFELKYKNSDYHVYRMPKTFGKCN